VVATTEVAFAQLPLFDRFHDTAVRAFAVVAANDPQDYKEEVKGKAEAANSDGGCRAHVVEAPAPKDANAGGADLLDYAVEILVESGGCTHYYLAKDGLEKGVEGDAIVEAMRKGRDLVAFDFARDGDTEVTGAAIEQGRVDLGTFVVTDVAVRRSGAKFLPQGPATSDMQERPWRFVEAVHAWILQDDKENDKHQAKGDRVHVIAK
jgi:hypothetical protein